MGRWLPIAAGVVLAGAAMGIVVGRAREDSRAERLEATLLHGAARRGAPTAGATVEFDALAELPPPVERYLKHVLTDGQPLIVSATLRQSGTLRTDLETDRWSPFSARHLAVPPAPGFVWDARVAMPLGTHVRVLDSYVAGVGAGRASLLSAFPVAAEAGGPEMNAGALHRYLAEAVWYPTALLPASGVAWTAIDEESALASLADGGTTVSLEFRFNQAGEVTGIYTPARFGTFDGEFRQAPWEGRFRNYRVLDGMRVPLYGEVGWYADGALHLVWKGDVTEARYEFDP